MSFAPAYLVYQLIFRIAAFFRHWYLDGARWFLARLALFSNAIHRIFGVRLPGPRFAEPSTVPSRRWGYLARALGSICGTILLAVGTFCAMFVFAVWASLPLLPLIFAVYGVRLDTVATAIYIL